MHIRQRINASAVVTDPENDPLGYSWRATRGTFPAGNVLSSVVWFTGPDTGSRLVTFKVAGTRKDAVKKAVESIVQKFWDIRQS